jgi:cytosine/adenosine deaminase-related metal-dependent hydrolase
MHYGHDHPDSHLIQDQAALGIDTHATFTTDIIGQARLWLQTTRLVYYRKALDNWQVPSTNPMSVHQAFLLATRAGGLALGRNDIGVLQIGAKADIVVIDGDSPNMLGWADAIAAVVLHSHVGDIRHVLVDGEFRKRDGQLVVPGNWTHVQQKFLASAKRIQGLWMNTPLPDLEGEYAAGVDYAKTIRVDVVRGNGTGY